MKNKNTYMVSYGFDLAVPVKKDCIGYKERDRYIRELKYTAMPSRIKVETIKKGSLNR